MRLHLPNSAFLGNIDAFLAAFNPSDPDRLEVSFNKKWISVHPVVLSMAAALGLAMKQQGKPVVCEDITAASKHYLERMGLTELLCMPRIPVHEHEAAGRFIPLTIIANSAQLDRFIQDITPLLHLKPAQAEPIKYIISELVRNVFEHAQSPVGAVVCAQFFKKTNRISLGVADAGVGIRQTIQRAYPAPRDLDAILLALQPGVTGTTRRPGGTETNAGAGLFFIKSIAKVNRDFFVIYSGNGLYKLRKDPRVKSIRLYGNPEKDKHSARNTLPYWQGTVVGIDISLDSSKDFNLLLDMIRDVYRLDIKQHHKERFKKARFI